MHTDMRMAVRISYLEGHKPLEFSTKFPHAILALKIEQKTAHRVKIHREFAC